MFRTRVAKTLGIRFPIVGGAMMWISDAAFTASISNAGALGILASAMFPTREEFANAVDQVMDLTDKPFAVNLNLFPSMRPIDNSEYLDVMIKKGVRIVETSGHAAPVELSHRFKESGMIWMHKCVGVRYALKVQDMGADIITVVGYENGGATGKLDIGSLALVPKVVESLNAPVIGGGGVCDGKSFLAMLALGAEGVIMGTRLLTTKEAPIHEKLKQALLEAGELDTILVMRSVGSTHRVWKNGAAEKCCEMEEQKSTLQELIKIVGGEQARKMYTEGNLDSGVISCGQCVGRCNDMPTMKELFDQIMLEAQTATRNLVRLNLQ
jgi:NADH:quinone reductase (non-electrogenic)